MFDTKRRQLESLEREVLGAPTPLNMVSLVERYMAFGDEERAADVARKALEKFPENDSCRTAYQNVRKVQLREEIQSLNRLLRTDPKKADYERLADLYHHELGNRNKAFEIALEGLTKFPNSDGLHMVSGLVRMDRFHQDFLANDFTEAANHFKKVVKVNPNHYKAVMSLARLYSEVGLYEKAQKHLEDVLRANPEDEQASHLWQIMTDDWQNMEQDEDDALSKVESRHALSKKGMEVAKVCDPQMRTGGSSAELDVAKLETFLAGFESMSGYKCSAVIRRDGSVMASHSRGVVPKEAFAEFVRAAYQCSEDAARRMDIGGFAGADIEASIGRVGMLECKDFIFGLLADQPAKPADVSSALDRFVSYLSVV